MGSKPPKPWAVTGLATVARLAFAAVLLPYFLMTAATEFGGTPYSVGPNMPGTLLSLGAFYQWAPWMVTDIGRGTNNLSILASMFLHLMVFSECVLPVLLVVGLATRTAAAGLMLLIAFTTLIDIFAHNAPAEIIGAWFDANPFDEIADLRLLWAMLIAIPLTLGGGPLSLDGLIARWHRSAAG